MNNKQINAHDTEWQLVPSRGVGAGRRSSRIWLLGAYTFLVVWSAAFLVFFFTNRLPF